MSGFTAPVTTNCEAASCSTARGQRKLLGMIHLDHVKILLVLHLSGWRRFECQIFLSAATPSEDACRDKRDAQVLGSPCVSLDDLTSDFKIQFELRHQLPRKRRALPKEAESEVMCELVSKPTDKKLGHGLADQRAE